LVLAGAEGCFGVIWSGWDTLVVCSRALRASRIVLTSQDFEKGCFLQTESGVS
jgi:hypothetical protein